MNIDKETYVNVINSIRDYYDFSSKIYKETDHMVSLFEIDPIDNMLNSVYKLLETLTNDEFEQPIGSNLSYFMWDLDFGRNKLAEFGIIEPDGTKIVLDTPEKLYDYLEQREKEMSQEKKENNET